MGQLIVGTQSIFVSVQVFCCIRKYIGIVGKLDVEQVQLVAI